MTKRMMTMTITFMMTALRKKNTMTMKMNNNLIRSILEQPMIFVRSLNIKII